MSPPRSAPWYKVPEQRIVNVEHPYIIKNIDKCIASLGGEAKVQKLVQDSNPSPLASLYLHPEDRNSKPTSSHNVDTDNIVLKITVPKRTGRRRKRGTSEPYHDAPEETQTQPSLTSRDTQYLLRSLRDTVGRYEIQPVGVVHKTHRFRNMPDFVTSTTGPGSMFMNKIRQDILPFKYEKLKKFKFDMSKGVKPNAELIAPPRWTHLSIPFNYVYKQNPLVKQQVDSQGNVEMANISIVPRLLNQPVPYNVSTIPTGPTPDLPAFETLEPALRRLVEQARSLFEQRPIWTRRALRNNLSVADWDEVGTSTARYIYQYVGYMYGSGPWRDAIVRFSVDPRTDPSYGTYQTMMFMLENEPADNRMNKLSESRTKQDSSRAAKTIIRNSHLFDGNHVSLDGKVWQICDITDPLLKSVLSTANLRDTCHIQGDGWFHNGTWAKAKTIMKHKIHLILTGKIPNDAVYLNVIRCFPDVYDQTTRGTAHLERGKATSLEYRIIGEMRTTAARHEYGRNYDKRMLDLARAGPVANSERETPDDALIDPAPPSGLQSDSRVVHALEELNKLERAGEDLKDLVDAMDVDGDERSLSEAEDEESKGLVDSEGMGSGESSSAEEADLAEDDDDDDEELGDADDDEDGGNSTAEEEVDE